MPMEFTGEGGDQEIDLGTINPLSGLGAASFTAWARPDAIGLADPTVIMSKGNTTGNDCPWKIQMQNGGDFIRGILDTGAGGDLLDAVTAFAAGIWAFIAMTYDGVNKRIYFNAVQDAIEAQTGNIIASALATRIASVNTGSPRREWDGLLDDIRIYNRTLSLAELETMYALRGIDNIVSGLVNRWRMNEQAPGVAASGAGSIKDLTGSFNGTPVASPVYREGILRI
jgi:hypothetical protein